MPKSTQRPEHPYDKYDTYAGEGKRDFGTTSWSQLCAAGTSEWREAFTYFAERYWRPIYCYLRARRRCSNDEAKELTQHFFLWMLETELLRKVKPREGRFRAFIKTCLENFVTGLGRQSKRIKRGGHLRIISWEEMAVVDLEPGSDQESPEAVLDKNWKEAVINEARQQLVQWAEKQGKTRWIQLWEEYTLSSESDELDYQVLAKRYGISPREVSHWLTTVRAQFRKAIAEVVGQTVSDNHALKLELKELFRTTRKVPSKE